MQNLQTLVCPHRIVQLVAFCNYATNEVDRNASMLQAHNMHIHAQAHDVRIHAHTHLQTHTHTHADTHTHTHTQKHTHSRTHNLFL